MKTLAKLSLLLALIVAARTLRQTEPAAAVASYPTPAHTAQPTPEFFEAYTSAQQLPVTPASHRTPAPEPSDTLALTWY